MSRTHGKVATYKSGCRCGLCRQANTDWQRDWMHADPERLRRHAERERLRYQAKGASVAEEPVTLAEIDAALEQADVLSKDEIALLWMCRGERIGVPVLTDHLPYLMGVDVEEAADICARLSEKGLIELV